MEKQREQAQQWLTATADQVTELTTLANSIRSTLANMEATRTALNASLAIAQRQIERLQFVERLLMDDYTIQPQH